MPLEPIRMPSVAGQFYEGSAEELRTQIEQCFLHPIGPRRLPKVNEAGPRRLLGLVSPHAGYMYSGPPAAKGFNALAADGRPKTAVVVGPSHRRPGRSAATQTAGAWRTPLGDMEIDAELAIALTEVSGAVVDAPDAVQGEHSLEVQLPFLQYVYGPELRLVPVMMMQQDWCSARKVGEALACALEDQNAVIVASTDMTHYEPAETAKRRDKALIDRMLALDPDGLCREAMRPGMSMCGFGPVAAMLLATRALGAVRAEVIAYSTSGDMQRMSDVVAYLALSVSR